MVKLGFQLLFSKKVVLKMFLSLRYLYTLMSRGGFYETKYLARSFVLRFLILRVEIEDLFLLCTR